MKVPIQIQVVVLAILVLLGFVAGGVMFLEGVTGLPLVLSGPMAAVTALFLVAAVVFLTLHKTIWKTGGGKTASLLMISFVLMWGVYFTSILSIWWVRTHQWWTGWEILAPVVFSGVIVMSVGFMAIGLGVGGRPVVVLAFILPSGLLGVSTAIDFLTYGGLSYRSSLEGGEWQVDLCPGSESGPEDDHPVWSGAAFCRFHQTATQRPITLPGDAALVRAWEAEKLQPGTERGQNPLKQIEATVADNGGWRGLLTPLNLILLLVGSGILFALGGSLLEAFRSSGGSASKPPAGH